MESACYAIRCNLEQLQQVHGRPFERVILVGGASHSPLWSQMLADILGTGLRLPKVAEAAAVAGGRVVLQGHRDLWRGPLPAEDLEADPQLTAPINPTMNAI